MSGMAYEISIPKILLTKFTALAQRQWQELARSNDSPRRLALAFAIGAFISLLPLPGLDLALMTVLAAWFKQLNRAALYAAAAVWNSFVVAPFYALSHQVGGFIFQTGRVPEIPFSGQTGLLVQRFLLGNLVVAFSVTAVSFLIVQTGLTLYRARTGVAGGRPAHQTGGQRRCAALTAMPTAQPTKTETRHSQSLLECWFPSSQRRKLPLQNQRLAGRRTRRRWQRRPFPPMPNFSSSTPIKSKT
ncbi:MAG: DUF2062 domain-containing protein [Chloroflexi bacterium]|nr:DUF2062 domain-containing protein [Chloroflexota bacterium]